MKSELFSNYSRERDELLDSLATFLSNRPEVSAAWLWGSVGKGQPDALSDLDLWVVVEDEAITGIIANPRQWTAQFAPSILIVEAPQNAPEGGAYLMAGFDAPTAPHLVDWYWQPRSRAFIPPSARLLFDKAALPRRSKEPVFPSSESAPPQTPFQAISFFWMMLMIVAKKIFRQPGDEIELIHHLVDALNTAQGTLRSAGRVAENAIPAHATPSQKLQVLYYFAGEMVKVLEAVQDEGKPVPAEIVPGAYRYLKMIEAGLDG